jgi:hypothetical protein
MTYPDPAEPEAARTPARAGRSRTRRPKWLVIVLVLLVAGAAVVGVLVLTGHDSIIPVVGGPTRADFTFQMGDVSTTSLGGKHADAVGDQVSAPIQTTLSDLYAGLFLDPHAWSTAPPDDVYDHFTERAAEQAKIDGAALGLGDLTGTIDTLKTTSSSLEIHVLADKSNHAVAALARVQYVADATTKSGQHIRITKDATYTLENDGGTWLVSGYPQNLLSVEIVKPSAGPSGATGSSS